MADGISEKILLHFQMLAQADATLPGGIARYALAGDNPAILLTLQSPAVQEAWRRRERVYPRRDNAGLFTDMAAWRPDQARRLGEAMAALEPITSDWGYPGSRRSPPWLRHLAALWLVRDRAAQPLGTLLALAGAKPEAVTSTLDIVLDDNLDRFTGAQAWLESEAAAILTAIGGFGADTQAVLATAIGRFGLHGAYLDFLIDLAAGRGKQVRTAARQALTGAPPDRLAEALRRHFAAAAPGQRAELADVAAILGHRAPPLLAAWRQEEKAAKVFTALDRVSSAMAPAADRAKPDGPDGYTAVDGTWVATPPCPAEPGPSPIPADVLRLLVPAMDQFNRLLEAARREGTAQDSGHWYRRYTTLGQEDLEKIAALGAGTDPVIQGRQYVTIDRPAVEWLRNNRLRHPAEALFFNDPRLSLYHLVRFAVAMSNGDLARIFNGWNGPVGGALLRRLENAEAGSVDCRTIFHLWERAGGEDCLAGYLINGYGAMDDLGLPLWPALCERFALLDEALGLVPQSGREAVRLVPALGLLASFPRLPERYRSRLLLLAHDSSRYVRQPARDLLRQTPNLGEAIAIQLRDEGQNIRAFAAEWLSVRGERDQAPAIRAALAGEGNDMARAAMITALSRMGEDVSACFDPAALLKEAKAGLAKARPKGLGWFPTDQLPALAWADGTPVDPLLPQWWLVLAAKLKQPGGNAMIDLWLDRLAPGQAHRLGWMVLTLWIDEDTRKPTDEEANAYADERVDAVVQRYIDNIRQWPQSADYLSTDRAIVFAELKRERAGVYLGSAADTKGILALAARVHSADAAQRISAFLKNHGKRTAQAKALLDVLAAIGSGAALQLLFATATRYKQRQVRIHAAALAEQLAERHGWTTAELADRTAPTGGFDAGGMQDIVCGEGRIYRLRLGADDRIAILNAEGREVKALPAPRNEGERAATDDARKYLAAARKEVKLVFTEQAGHLREAMQLQRSWQREDWESVIASHPIVGRLAARLIWQGLDEAGQPLASFRPLGDGSFTDAADHDVNLADFARIGLAHASLLSREACAAWRTHLADYTVQPPFDQISRELPMLNEAQARDTSIDDRKGWTIGIAPLRSAAEALGYRRDQSSFNGANYEKICREARLIVEITSIDSPRPGEEHNVALQSLNFRTLGANDGHGRRVALSNVPPILLAESWQDLHDIADKGDGYDPEWEKIHVE